MSVLVGDDGKTPLMIGAAEVDLGQSGQRSLQRYDSLSSTQKLSLLQDLQIYKGWTANAQDGFTQTFSNCIVPWHENTLPQALMPRIVTKIRSDFAFTQVEKSLMTSSVDKASVNVTTPYGDANSSFSYAKTNSTKSKDVTEHLIGKFIVQKVNLQVNLANLQLTSDYEDAITNALTSSNQEIDQCANLVEVLNERGYYIPIEFTLGGMLYSSSSTTISDFSQAETEKTDFSVGFKVAIDGIGGGGDYSHSEGRETSTSTSTKYKNLAFDQIGGKPGTQKAYDDWIKSLEAPINWNIISLDKMYPTIALHSNGKVRRYCVQLLQTYSTYPAIMGRQTVIDLFGYETAIQQVLAQQPASM